MKKHFIINIIAIPCSLFITSVRASDHLQNKKLLSKVEQETTFRRQSENIIKFPVQPGLVYKPSQAFNPFKMTSLSIGKSYVRYHRDINKTFKEKKWFDSLRSHVYEIKLELPFYQKNTSLGFDWTIFYDKIYDTKLDYGSQFSEIWAVDMLATLKFKWPFHTDFGHFAWTVTSKAGLVYILLATDHQTQPLYQNNLGFVAGAAIGIDYYFSQWLGMFIEYGAKYNKIQFLHTKDNPQQPYAYTTTALTFGIKTTF